MIAMTDTTWCVFFIGLVSSYSHEWCKMDMIEDSTRLSMIQRCSLLLGLCRVCLMRSTLKILDTVTFPRHFYWDVRIGYEFYWSFGPGFCICMCTEHKINVQAIFIPSLLRLLASHYSYSSIRCYYSGMVVRKPMLNLMWDLRTQLAPSYDQLGRRTLSINR